MRDDVSERLNALETDVRSLEQMRLGRVEQRRQRVAKVTAVNAGTPVTYDANELDAADNVIKTHLAIENRAVPALQLSVDDIAPLFESDGVFFFVRRRKFGRFGFGPEAGGSDYFYSGHLDVWRQRDVSASMSGILDWALVDDTDASNMIAVAFLDGVSIARTTNSGWTWSVVTVAGLGKYRPYEITAVSGFPKQCICMDGNGYVYALENNDGDTDSDSNIWRSTDDGASWTKVATVTDYDCATMTLSVTPEDALLLLRKASGSATIFRSTDQGATWTFRKSFGIGTGNEPPRIHTIGTDLVIYHHQSSGGYFHYYKTVSTNDGVTWATSQVVDGSGNDFYMPFFDRIYGLIAGGYITVCRFHEQATPTSLSNPRYVCTSADGETGWTPVRSMTTDIWDFYFWETYGDDGRLLVIGGANEQEYSDDGGSTWTDITVHGIASLGDGGLVLDFS